MTHLETSSGKHLERMARSRPNKHALAHPLRAELRGQPLRLRARPPGHIDAAGLVRAPLILHDQETDLVVVLQRVAWGGQNYGYAVTK